MSQPSRSSGSSEEITFDELFDSFCRVGDRSSEDIALRNIDKWFKQAKLFSKEITPTDTAIIFAKIAKNRKKITKDEFREMLSELAKEKQMEASDLEVKLEAAGRPSFSGVTKPIRGSVAADNMERLTDPSGYTGSHRERFDEEGKGLGLSGRYDVVSPDSSKERARRSSSNERALRSSSKERAQRSSSKERAHRSSSKEKEQLSDVSVEKNTPNSPQNGEKDEDEKK